MPTFVQRLQFTVKDHTVGKAATFTKVDNVIQETKNLMNVISKVVTTCFECATKVSFNNFSLFSFFLYSVINLCVTLIKNGIVMPQRIRIPYATLDGRHFSIQFNSQVPHRFEYATLPR